VAGATAALSIVVTAVVVWAAWYGRQYCSPSLCPRDDSVAVDVVVVAVFVVPLAVFVGVLTYRLTRQRSVLKDQVASKAG
jgi:hypothetical protein